MLSYLSVAFLSSSPLLLKYNAQALHKSQGHLCQALPNPPSSCVIFCLYKGLLCMNQNIKKKGRVLPSSLHSFLPSLFQK